MQRIPKAINKKRLVRYKEGAEMFLSQGKRFRTNYLSVLPLHTANQSPFVAPALWSCHVWTWVWEEENRSDKVF